MMMMKSVFWWRKPEYPEETPGYSGTCPLGRYVKKNGLVDLNLDYIIYKRAICNTL